jgi:hypothetical protein
MPVGKFVDGVMNVFDPFPKSRTQRMLMSDGPLCCTPLQLAKHGYRLRTTNSQPTITARPSEAAELIAAASSTGAKILVGHHR